MLYGSKVAEKGTGCTPTPALIHLEGWESINTSHIWKKSQFILDVGWCLHLSILYCFSLVLPFPSSFNCRLISESEHSGGRHVTLVDKRSPVEVLFHLEPVFAKSCWASSAGCRWQYFCNKAFLQWIVFSYYFGQYTNGTMKTSWLKSATLCFTIQHLNHPFMSQIVTDEINTENIKGALCSFGEAIWDLQWPILLCLNRRNKDTL